MRKKCLAQLSLGSLETISVRSKHTITDGIQQEEFKITNVPWVSLP